MTAATPTAGPQVDPILEPKVARPNLDHPTEPKTVWALLAIGVAGLLYAAYSIHADLGPNAQYAKLWPFILLGVALLIALGFEFVNGFHDTANAVATVIYTHALSAPTAVAWSGLWNFIGVLTSSGLVAFGIVSLLPVELILQVGHGAGFAMVFALLIAAIIWNLGTWWFGLPASSSHTLIGSIIGVGVMNALLHGRDGTSGVDWGKATDIGYALLLSPLFGFVLAYLLLILMKFLVRAPALYTAPTTQGAPPLWIRALLIFTCTLVSFFHGSNDGQKGMGLIMLILIGTVPTAYALNHDLPNGFAKDFGQVSSAASKVIDAKADNYSYSIIGDPRPTVTAYISRHQITEGTFPALAALIRDVAKQVEAAGAISALPLDQVSNLRNDMYLTSDAIRFLLKDKEASLSADNIAALKAYKAKIDQATKFIPNWVKVVVAIALGLGTMIGWKRIVVTVGEKIGKTHLTYGQGAAAELVAASTIGVAETPCMPKVVICNSG